MTIAALPPMVSELTLPFRDREAWRAFLAERHGEDLRVWVVFFKKHTGEVGVSYDDALDEALCFGWIDSLIRRIDDGSYARLFTPRRDAARWSALNLARVRTLLAAGRMTEAGKAKLGVALPPEDAPRAAAKGAAKAAPRAASKPAKVPPDLEAALRASAPAWAAFEALPPSHRRAYVAWITSAKRAETQAKRVREAIGRLVKGEPLGMK